MNRSMWLALLFAFFLSGCSNTPLDSFAMMPKAPTEGPPEYIEGWKQGCETGMTAYSNDMMRSLYEIKVDGPMMADPRYDAGWQLGNKYCSYYVSRYLAAGYYDDPTHDGDHDLRDDNFWGTNPNSDFFSGWKLPYW